MGQPEETPNGLIIVMGTFSMPPCGHEMCGLLAIAEALGALDAPPDMGEAPAALEQRPLYPADVIPIFRDGPASV